jgi:hypothetical protein
MEEGQIDDGEDDPIVEDIIEGDEKDMVDVEATLKKDNVDQLKVQLAQTHSLLEIERVESRKMHAILQAKIEGLKGEVAGLQADTQMKEKFISSTQQELVEFKSKASMLEMQVAQLKAELVQRDEVLRKKDELMEEKEKKFCEIQSQMNGFIEGYKVQKSDENKKDQAAEKNRGLSYQQLKLELHAQQQLNLVHSRTISDMGTTIQSLEERLFKTEGDLELLSQEKQG